jgi:hypothetical protein
VEWPPSARISKLSQKQKMILSRRRDEFHRKFILTFSCNSVF